MKLINKKRTLSFILSLIMMISVSTSFAFSANASDDIIAEDYSEKKVGLSERQQYIVDRADYLYDITWVCQSTIYAHAYSAYYTFYAGETYRLPYGQAPTANYIGYGVSPEYFMEVAADPNSEFYAYQSYAGTWYSAYYITDCSGFVSWAWGLSSKQSTRSLANYSSYIASVTTNNIYNYLEVGDALNRYDYHVVLVTDMFYDDAGNLTGIEITEQAIPEMQRYVYTPSELASLYANYDGIYRYYGDVPPAPTSKNNKLEGHEPIFIGNDFAAYIRHTASGKYVTDVDNNLKAEDGRFDASQAFHFFYNSDDGTYSMYSDAKNKWFDVAESSYTDGTNVGLWDGNGQENQRFYMYYINGNFYFRPKAECIVFDIAAHDGNLALWGDSTGDNDVSRTARAFEVLKINMDYSDWYLDLGADDVVYIRNVASGLLMTGDWNQDVWFSGPDYTDSQKWKLLRRADGSYEFMHVMTGKLLDVEGGFIDSGTRVNLWDCNGQKGQGFYILPGDENAYVIKPCYTEHVLDMAAENGDVGIYPPHLDWDVPRAAQLFEIVFEKIDGNTIPAENIGTDFKATITTKKTGNALTDLGNGVLEAHKNTNANNQIFKFYYDASSNSYEIVGNSGKAIDVTGTGYTNGTSVGLFDRNNWVAQRFHLHKVGEYYALSPIFTNRVVDVDNNNNTTVILWGTDVTDNRLFKITPVTDTPTPDPEPTPDPDPSEDTLVLKNTSKYSKDGSILYNVAAGQTASGLISNFDNSSIEIHDANGKKVANNAKVGTGYTVNLIVNGTKYDSVTVVIKGDVTGDGIVDTTDYMRVKAQFLGTYNLTSCYKLAADTDSNNVIDTTDYLRVKNHFIGVYNLYA